MGRKVPYLQHGEEGWSAVGEGCDEHQGFQLAASVGALLGKLLSHERKVLGSRMCGEAWGAPKRGGWVGLGKG